MTMFLAVGCYSSATQLESTPPSVLAVAYVDNDSVAVSRQDSRGCALAFAGEGMQRPDVFTPDCFTSIDRISPSKILLESDRSAASFGDRLASANGVVAAAAEDQVTRSAGAELVWRHATQQIRLGHLRQPRISAEGAFVVGIRDVDDSQALTRIAASGEERVLYRASSIDSFDLDPKGKEVAFSAQHDGSFDVAVVSSDGGEPRWVAPERADERLVRWAPRGNKISYVISTYGGSTVRTVHLPTSVQLSVALPLTEVTDLAWQPAAERFAAVVSTPAASPHVLTMKYGGEEQRAITAATKLDAEMDQLGESGDVVLIPAHPKYGRKYPVVVVFDGDSRFAWSDAAASVFRSFDVITVRTTENRAKDLAALRTQLAQLPFADQSRIVFVAIGPQRAGAAQVLHAQNAAAAVRAVKRALHSTP